MNHAVREHMGHTNPAIAVAVAVAVAVASRWLFSQCTVRLVHHVILFIILYDIIIFRARTLVLE